MSPEQAEGKAVDSRSDIFSTGVLLYEMATGERPFKGDTGLSVISAILKDTPPSVTDVRPDVPKDIARVVKRCLAKDPQRRFQSTIDLRNGLEDIRQEIESSPVAAPLHTASVHPAVGTASSSVPATGRRTHRRS
jgi:eukaryotic-like serine/threonine-protein kinase